MSNQVYHFDNVEDPENDIVELIMDDENHHHIKAGKFIIPHTWSPEEKAKKKTEIIQRMKKYIQQYLGAKYS